MNEWINEFICLTEKITIWTSLWQWPWPVKRLRRYMNGDNITQQYIDIYIIGDVYDD